MVQVNQCRLELPQPVTKTSGKELPCLLAHVDQCFNSFNFNSCICIMLFCQSLSCLVISNTFGGVKRGIFVYIPHQMNAIIVWNSNAVTALLAIPTKYVNHWLWTSNVKLNWLQTWHFSVEQGKVFQGRPPSHAGASSTHWWQTHHSERK